METESLNTAHTCTDTYVFIFSSSGKDLKLNTAAAAARTLQLLHLT